jgi:acetyltransferase-like isoleucine patch superfamily enzyme
MSEADVWETKTGLTREEFEKMTIFIHRSNNNIDNLNRGRILGYPGVHIAPGAQVRLVKTGSIAPGSFIGLFSYVNGDVVLERCAIGPHCSITSHTHMYDPETDRFSGSRHKRITIKKHSWLAAGCMVTSGVTIGRCNLICANCVVTKDTPDYAIVAGTPGKVVGRIDPETGEYAWFHRQKEEEKS